MRGYGEVSCRTLNERQMMEILQGVDGVAAEAELFAAGGAADGLGGARGG